MGEALEPLWCDPSNIWGTHKPLCYRGWDFWAQTLEIMFRCKILSLLEFSSFLFLVFIYFFFKHTLLNLVNICWLLLPLFTKLLDLFLPDFPQLYPPCRPDLLQVVSNYSKQKSSPGLRKTNSSKPPNGSLSEFVSKTYHLTLTLLMDDQRPVT